MDENLYETEHGFKIDPEFAQMASMTDDELLINYFDLIEKEIYKKRNMILLPDSIERLRKVTRLIETFLHYNSVTDYKISTDVFKLDPTELLVFLETSFFGVGPNKKWLWEELMRLIFAFSVEPAPNGRFRFVFSMKDMLQEIEGEIEISDNNINKAEQGEENKDTGILLEKFPVDDDIEDPVYMKFTKITNNFIDNVNSLNGDEKDVRNDLKSNLRNYIDSLKELTDE